MIYTHTLESFNLYSQWSCYYKNTSGSNWSWQIRFPPTSDSKTLIFPVSLPSDAVVDRAWVSMEVGSSSGGAAYFKMNSKSVPSSREVEVDTINAETTSFQAEFSYKANGVIYPDHNTHTSTLKVNNPTLHIQYFSESESTPEIDPDSPGNIIREHSGRQLVRLLDSSMNEIARIAGKLSLDLELDPLSTAQMEIPWGQPTVHVRDFVELFSPSESAGIYRVSKVEQDVGVSTQIWLKHAFVTLEDDITVGVHAMEGTFAQVVTSLLAAQTVPRWMLGDVALPEEYTLVYAHGYTTIKSAIMDLFEKLPAGYYWELDTLHYPWVMHLRALPEDDLCEGRISRNLKGVQITRDDRDLCTRVYPYGAGEDEDRINLSTLTGALFMDADTKETWGAVTKTFTEEDVFDSITLQEVARLYLEQRKNPLLSITLDAINLELVTGESIDKFYPGRLCRLALPDHDIIMHERVISISYPDVYGNPGAATVTLANKVRDSFDDLSNLVREATSSKLIGGTVKTDEIKEQSGDHTTSNPKSVHFNIETYGDLLAASIEYRCLNVTDSYYATCALTVDGNTVLDQDIKGYSANILPYLTKDENGIPTVGEHYVRLRPESTVGDKHRISCTVTLKTIERK